MRVFLCDFAYAYVCMKYIFFIFKNQKQGREFWMFWAYFL